MYPRGFELDERQPIVVMAEEKNNLYMVLVAMHWTQVILLDSGGSNEAGLGTTCMSSVETCDQATCSLSGGVLTYW